MSGVECRQEWHVIISFILSSFNFIKLKKGDKLCGKKKINSHRERNTDTHALRKGNRQIWGVLYEWGKISGADCLYAETENSHSFSLSPTDNENQAIR